MRSLSTRLMLTVALAASVSLAVWSVWLYYSMAGALQSQFDDTMRSRAQTLASLVEQNGREIEFEGDPASLVEYLRGPRADFFQVFLSQGRTLARSPSLMATHLDRNLPSNISQAVTLPDGRPGRGLAYRFIPRPENHLHGATDLRQTLLLHDGESTLITVVVARDTSDFDASLSLIFWRLVLMGGASVLFTATLLAILVRRGLEPLRTLATEIGAVDHVDLARRIDLPDVPAELAPVVTRLNEMLDRLQSTVERERAFAADVAHELRTPLASVRTALELSASRPRSTQDYQSTIGHCLDSLKDMGFMVENLLMLARAESEQLTQSAREIDLASHAQEQWMLHAPLAAARGITVQWDVGNPVTIRVDPSLLDLVLRNLFDNAVSYTPQPGAITIVVRTADPARVELVVRNTVQNIQPQDLQHLFDRFWRGQLGRDAQGRHHGLGLPLCQRLIGSMGGVIRAALPSPQEFEILIGFPAPAGK